MNNNSVQIHPITDKAIWEDFLLQQDLPPFLQSWNAAEQSEELGNQTLRLGIYHKSKLVGVALVECIRAKRGSYLFLPYGPVLIHRETTLLRALIDYLTMWGKQHEYDFIRLAPYWEKTSESMTLLKGLGFNISPIHMLSEIVWKLDLTSNEDALLMQMRKTTRNLIRRAIKEGVTVRFSKNPEDVETFIRLMRATHKRHHFVAYPDQLYVSQVKQFASDDEVAVLTADYENKSIASAIIMYYGNVASYHHGASIPSKIPAAYLLQWEAIKEAKRRGCREYSFWGIVESDNPKHPFVGITRFKKGFGGSVRYLVPAHDMALSSRYRLTYLIETIRRIKRGFGLKRG